MAEHSNGAFRTSIGGQALIEGILMRGPEKQAIVVRDKDGQMVEKVEELKLIKDRYPILGVPLIRGTVNFLSAMVSGVKALMYSADFYPDEEVSQPSKFEEWLEKHLSSEKLEKAIVAFAVLLGVGMSGSSGSGRPGSPEHTDRTQSASGRAHRKKDVFQNANLSREKVTEAVCPSLK